MNGLADAVGTLKSITGSSPSVGWLCDGVSFLLYGLVKFYRPQLVVQTGHLWGKSAAVILEALHDDAVIEHDPQRGDPAFTAFTDANTPQPGPGRMVSVDSGPPVANPGAGVTWLADHYQGFEYIQSPSSSFFASPRFAELVAGSQGQRVLGIVDGDHNYEPARADLENMLRLGRPWVFLDDTRWIPHLGTLAHEFAGEHGYQLLDLPMYNGVCLLVPEGT